MGTESPTMPLPSMLSSPLGSRRGLRRSNTEGLESEAITVVPQAAEFTYILFTQEISTRVTSCQHGLSDLNKRYFQLDIS